MDCTWAILEGKRMGFGTEEMLQMTYGNFLDYLITQNEIISTIVKRKPEEKKESLMDL